MSGYHAVVAKSEVRAFERLVKELRPPERTILALCGVGLRAVSFVGEREVVVVVVDWWSGWVVGALPLLYLLHVPLHAVLRLSKMQWLSRKKTGKPVHTHAHHCWLHLHNSIMVVENFLLPLRKLFLARIPETLAQFVPDTRSMILSV